MISPSFSQALASLPRVLCPSFQNQMVMRYDSGYSGTSNLDWFESRLVFPSKAVEGLQRVLDSDTSKAKAYFRNIAKSEPADAISKDSCSATPAMCSTSGLAAGRAALPPAQIAVRSARQMG